MVGRKAIEMIQENSEIDLVLIGRSHAGNWWHWYDDQDQNKLFRKYLSLSKRQTPLPSVHERAVNGGCDEFITKPIDIDILQSILKKYLFWDGRPPDSPIRQRFGTAISLLLIRNFKLKREGKRYWIDCLRWNINQLIVHRVNSLRQFTNRDRIIPLNARQFHLAVELFSQYQSFLAVFLTSTRVLYSQSL